MMIFGLLIGTIMGLVRDEAQNDPDASLTSPPSMFLDHMRSQAKLYQWSTCSNTSVGRYDFHDATSGDQRW
jgi:hypothetical protein